MPGGATIQIRRAGSRGYDNPILINYQIGGAHDFGAGSSSYYVQPPDGCNFGQVYDIQVSVTETFDETGSAAFVRIGNTDDADKYAELDMGTAANNAVYGSYDVDIFTSGKTGRIDMNRDATAGTSITQVIIAYVTHSGSGTGKGWTSVSIGWW